MATVTTEVATGRIARRRDDAHEHQGRADFPAAGHQWLRQRQKSPLLPGNKGDWDGIRERG